MTRELLETSFGAFERTVSQAVFGPIEPVEVARLLDDVVADELGALVEHARWFQASVGCVFGLRLTDGRDVVLKAYQRRWTAEFLGAVHAVQRHLASTRFPCPVPIAGPLAIGGTLATIDLAVPDPGAASGEPHQLATSARGLAEQIELCRQVDAPGLTPHPMSARESGLYPEPHSPVFNFEATSAGAEWIDDLAVRALVVRDAEGAAPVIAHTDWSARNVRFDRDGVVVAYDWDSLAYIRETTALGQAAATWSAATGAEDAPSVDDVVAYTRAYEIARGRAFSSAERAAVGGAALYVLAYTGRCEHATDPQGGTRGRARTLLASSGEQLLDLPRHF